MSQVAGLFAATIARALLASHIVLTYYGEN